MTKIYNIKRSYAEIETGAVLPGALSCWRNAMESDLSGRDALLVQILVEMEGRAGPGWFFARAVMSIAARRALHAEDGERRERQSTIPRPLQANIATPETILRISQCFAGLRRRGLVETRVDDGRDPVVRLTPAGREVRGDCCAAGA